MFSWFKPKRSFSEIRDRLRLPIDEARRKASILVIDDDEQAFPVNLMIAEGYKVTWWPQLKSIRNLEDGQFDIIVLDIYGVCAPSVSENEGIGVLEHLKRVNPAQIIIAYSGQKFDLKQEKFWRLADDFLGKPSTLIECRNKIDQLLQEKYTGEHYWRSLVSTLTEAGVRPSQISSLETELVRAIEQNKPLGREAIFSVLKISKDLLSTSWIIVQIILRISST